MARSPSLKALEHYEKAIALDSAFAKAWARKAQVKSSRWVGSRTNQLAEEARQASEKALALAPALPESHLASGLYQTLVRHDYQRAIQDFDAGLALSPANPELLGSKGLAEQGLGDYDRAIDYMRRGLAEDPHAVLFIRRLTRALTWSHRFAEADEEARKALALAPADPSSIQYAALNHLSQGDLAGARTFFSAIPQDSTAEVVLAYWAANPIIAGWALPEEQRRRIMRVPVNAFGDRVTWAYSLAMVAQGLGDAVATRAFADSRHQWPDSKHMECGPSVRLRCASHGAVAPSLDLGCFQSRRSTAGNRFRATPLPRSHVRQHQSELPQGQQVPATVEPAARRHTRVLTCWSTPGFSSGSFWLSALPNPKHDTEMRPLRAPLTPHGSPFRIEGSRSIGNPMPNRSLTSDVNGESGWSAGPSIRAALRGGTGRTQISDL